MAGSSPNLCPDNTDRSSVRSTLILEPEVLKTPNVRLIQRIR